MRRVLASALAMLVVACQGDETSNGQSSIEDGPEPVSREALAQALTFVSPDTDYVTFTNWEALKDANEAEDVTGGDTLEERQEFYASIAAQDWFNSAFPSFRYEKHVEDWGWDSVDLEWEAFFGREGQGYAFVLGFGDRFSASDLQEQLERRDIPSSEHRGVPIFSTREGLTDPVLWDGPILPTTDVSLANTAILESEDVAIMSVRREDVVAVLDAHGGASQSDETLEHVRGVLDDLDHLHGVTIVSEPGTCERETARVLPATREALEQLTLHPYASYGFGYADTGDGALGTFVMHYTDADAAEDDLEERVGVIRELDSALTGEPYGESAFQLVDASVEGTDIVLQLAPAQGQLRVTDLVESSDLAFAAC